MLGRWAILDVGRGFGTTGPPAATWSPGHLAAELGVGPDEQVCTLHTAHRTPHRSVQVQRGIGAGSNCMDNVRGEDRLGLTPARGAPIRVQIRSALDRPLQFPFVFLFAQPRRRHLLATRQTRPEGREERTTSGPGPEPVQPRVKCV